MKYHINNKGEVKRCLALIRMCMYGSEAHFSSQEQGNKVNDLVLTRKAKNYSEAKAIVLKELYQKKSNEAFRIISKNGINSHNVRVVKSVKYYNEIISDLEKDLKVLKDKKNSLISDNNQIYKDIELFDGNTTKTADKTVEYLYEKSMKNDKKIEELDKEIQEKVIEINVHKEMKKESETFSNLVKNKNTDMYVRNAKEIKNGKNNLIYLDNIKTDKDGKINNLFFQGYDGKITSIDEITEDNRFLNNFKDINIENGHLFTIDTNRDLFESFAIVF